MCRDRRRFGRSNSALRWAGTEAAEGVRRRRVGLSPTEASSVGGPEFIGVVTEAREEFCLTTPGAPTGAAKSPAITTPRSNTDACKESQ